MRLTWHNRSDGDEAPARALRQMAAFNALDRSSLSLCGCRRKASFEDVLAHMAGHEIGDGSQSGDSR
jgi:hypothetical protein